MATSQGKWVRTTVTDAIKTQTVSKANKRIPVTEERWKELNELKEAGQTYDELLEGLIKERNRRQLADRAQEVREAETEELTPLDEL